MDEEGVNYPDEHRMKVLQPAGFCSISSDREEEDHVLCWKRGLELADDSLFLAGSGIFRAWMEQALSLR